MGRSSKGTDKKPKKDTKVKKDRKTKTDQKKKKRREPSSSTSSSSASSGSNQVDDQWKLETEQVANAFGLILGNRITILDLKRFHIGKSFPALQICSFACGSQACQLVSISGWPRK